MTLRKRIVRYVRTYGSRPGKWLTATDIANALHAHPASVSSALVRLTRGEYSPLERWTGGGAWRYNTRYA
jgi:hypothetical protein